MIKKIFVFVGLKIREILGIIIIGFILAFALMGVEIYYPSQMQSIYKILNFMFDTWWMWIIWIPIFFLGGIGIMVENWEKAGKIINRRKNDDN